MAPRRGRISVPVGETRMDAALAAICPLGFKQDAIRRKINELLKLYGRPAGWGFIEDESYLVVIEALMEEASEPGSSNSKQLENQDDMIVDSGSPRVAVTGTSNLTLETPWDVAQDFANADISDDLPVAEIEHPPPAAPLPPPQETEYPPPLPPLPPESEYIHPPPPPPPLETMHASISTPIPQHALPSHPFVAEGSASHPAPPRKRKPCYGWWGSSWDEKDIITLPAMPIKPRTRAAE